jgi:anti-sigma regulatory factor (Ser/Thr protein kinase)
MSADERGLHFIISNDVAMISRVSGAVREFLAGFPEWNEEMVLEVLTALEESLANAMIHGNLEVPSETRRDLGAFRQLIESRRSQKPYSERVVRIHVRLVANQLELHVRDDGPGFDPSRVPDSQPESPTGSAVWGNGLAIIRAFMDEVRHNEQGNEISMIRRFNDGDPIAP